MARSRALDRCAPTPPAPPRTDATPARRSPGPRSPSRRARRSSAATPAASAHRARAPARRPARRRAPPPRRRPHRPRARPGDLRAARHREEPDPARHRPRPRRRRPTAPPPSPPQRPRHHGRVLLVRESSPRRPALEVGGLARAGRAGRATVRSVPCCACTGPRRRWPSGAWTRCGRASRPPRRPRAPTASSRSCARPAGTPSRTTTAASWSTRCSPTPIRSPACRSASGARPRRSPRRCARSASTAASGRIAGEFCPGEHTVNARGAVKLVGNAQRVVRHASLLAASIAVTDAASLRAVLEDVYAALELEWDPETAGGVADEAPGGRRRGRARGGRRVRAAGASWSRRSSTRATLARARELEPRHGWQRSNSGIE